MLTLLNMGVIAQSFDKGQSMVSAGYGLGSYRVLFFSDIVKGPIGSKQHIKTSLTGPIYLKYEYMLDENISVGGNFAFIDYTTSNSFQSNYNGTDSMFTNSYHFFSYSILARINYHFTPEEAYDIYAGFSCGYRYVSSIFRQGIAADDVQSLTIPIGFEAVIGARILVTEKFGLYSEIGDRKSVV